MSKHPAMKFHTRHEWMHAHGRRISKGAWERMNRAYAVHTAKDDRGTPKMRVCGHRMNAQGEMEPLLTPCLTLVLLPETPRHHRKVTRRDRWNENSKRSRYREGEHVGVIK